MRIQKLLVLILLLYSSFANTQSLDDIKKLKDPKKLISGKGISIKGAISTNQVFYHSFNIENRRIPYTYLYTGNLNFSFFGKINMPFQYSFVNQNATFSNSLTKNIRIAQPFNRFVLKPTYKGITLHTGTIALNFSPYTLASHRTNGIGLTYKSNKKPYYGGFMLGSLIKATKVDSSIDFNMIRPNYKRFGWGFQLGLKKDDDLVELILFDAKDKLSSLPYSLDKFKITPKANTVGSIKVAKKINEQFSFKSEIAYSGITNDTRNEQSLSRKYFLQSFAGLLQNNSTTKYRKAINSELIFKGKKLMTSILYSKVDPGYQTFGAYYFNNDLETITVNAGGQIKDMISINGSIGTQKDNLDNTKLQTSKRLVGSLNTAVVLSENTNINFQYSTFSNYTNTLPEYLYLTQITPYNALDTLQYRQINKTLQSTLIQNFKSNIKDKKQTLVLSLLLQNSNDKQGNVAISTSLFNGNANYVLTNTVKNSSLSIGLVMSDTKLDKVITNTFGPNVNFSKQFLNKKLQLIAGGILSTFNSKNEDVGSSKGYLFNGKFGANATIKKNQKLKFMAVYLNNFDSKKSVSSSKLLSEITFNLGYTYGIDLLDFKFK